MDGNERNVSNLCSPKAPIRVFRAYRVEWNYHIPSRNLHYNSTTPNIRILSAQILGAREHVDLQGNKMSRMLSIWAGILIMQALGSVEGEVVDLLLLS